MKTLANTLKHSIQKQSHLQVMIKLGLVATVLAGAASAHATRNSDISPGSATSVHIFRRSMFLRNQKVAERRVVALIGDGAFALGQQLRFPAVSGIPLKIKGDIACRNYTDIGYQGLTFCAVEFDAQGVATLSSERAPSGVSALNAEALPMWRYPEFKGLGINGSADFMGTYTNDNLWTSANSSDVTVSFSGDDAQNLFDSLKVSSVRSDSGYNAQGAATFDSECASNINDNYIQANLEGFNAFVNQYGNGDGNISDELKADYLSNAEDEHQFSYDSCIYYPSIQHHSVTHTKKGTNLTCTRTDSTESDLPTATTSNVSCTFDLSPTTGLMMKR